MLDLYSSQCFHSRRKQEPPKATESQLRQLTEAGRPPPPAALGHAGDPPAAPRGVRVVPQKGVETKRPTAPKSLPEQTCWLGGAGTKAQAQTASATGSAAGRKTIRRRAAPRAAREAEGGERAAPSTAEAADGWMHPESNQLVASSTQLVYWWAQAPSWFNLSWDLAEFSVPPKVITSTAMVNRRSCLISQKLGSLGSIIQLGGRYFDRFDA